MPAQSILYRLFGIGGVPATAMAALRQEGLVLVEEGVRGWITYRNFRAPGKRSSYRVSWFVGSLVITQARFAAFTFSKPIVNIALEAEWLEKLRCELEGDSRLLVTFEAATFDTAVSGTIECRFTTPKAHLFIDQIRARAS